MAQLINPLTSYFDGVYSDLENIRVSRGFMSIFANGGMGSRTRYIENATQISVDLYRGYKKISKVLSRGPNPGVINLGENAQHVKADYWQNVAYDFPLIQDSASVSYAELLKYRAFGRVDTDVSMDVIEKAREQLGRDLLTIIQMQGGKMEAMAVEALCSAKITLDDGTEYDFDRSTSNTITPIVLWSVAATASPLSDLDDACDAVQENGKTDAAACIMGYEAYASMINTNEISNFAKDNNRVDLVAFGRLKDAMPASMQYLIDAGFTYKGSVLTYKDRTIYIFGYNEKYQNAAGTWVNYFNSKDALVFDHMARRDRYFGPRIRFEIMDEATRELNRVLGLDILEQMAVREAEPNGILDVGMFHFDSFMNLGRTNIFVECYTGPLFIPTAVDTTCLLDGVTA